MSLFFSFFSRLRRGPRYDPYPDLVALQDTLFTEILAEVKHKGLTQRSASLALDATRRTISDYTLYATIGKDRRKLGPEWVEKAEGAARKGIDTTLACYAPTDSRDASSSQPEEQR